MAIGRRNSGKFKQDGILSQMGKDAKLPISQSSAVAVACEGREQRAKYREEQAAIAAAKPRMSFYVPR
jgi:hypothetical protein